MFIQSGYEVVVVGDLKTDESLWGNLNQKIHFLSYKDQEEISQELSNLIGPNSYARKNFGYLYAARSGAEIILDTDDDTFFRDSVLCPLEFTKKSKRLEFFGQNTFNPYSHYAPGTKLWPRGYPLRELFYNLNYEKSSLRNSVQSETDVYQFLVSGEPDVDAIYRLTVTPEAVDFEVNSELVDLPIGTFTPANTQATFWVNRKKFEYLYIPRNVAFRFCDILKMYVAQTNTKLTYGGFLFEQIRNDHDLMKDFESEVEVYLNTEKTIVTLSQNEPESLLACYQLLFESEVVPQNEKVIAQLFSEKMNEYLNC